MVTSPSTIPHLARAILEKKQSHAINTFTKYCRVAYGSNVIIKPFAEARCQFSSSHIAQQGTPSQPSKIASAPGRSRALKPLPETESIQNLRKTYPYGIEPPTDEVDDPSKDSVRQDRYRQATFGFIVVVSGFIAYVYQSYKNDLQKYYAKGNILKQDEDVSSRWRDATRDFDQEVDAAERLMLLKWKRQRLVREAYGDVLEVSVGTGRNMDLYDTRPYVPTESVFYGRDTRHMITSLTFNDESPVMIDNAKKKWTEEQQRKRKEDRFAGEVYWYTGDAGRKNVILRPPGGYDTIVQSWGICSMADPVKFLRHLGRLVRQPGEQVQNTSPKKFREQEGEDGKGGRIFLLEHGRGKYEWLNKFLDNSAPMHADRYGCWYNKDIAKVIEESGLVVERVRRYNFGTTYEYVLRPALGPLPGEETTVNTKPIQEKAEKSPMGWLSRLR